jgi:transcriptional regulator of acetoin/glycerol metabolism
VTAAALPTGTGGAYLTLEELERAHIERVLSELGGRVTEASQRLGIPRSTLYQKIKRFGLALPRT